MQTRFSPDLIPLAFFPPSDYSKAIVEPKLRERKAAASADFKISSRLAALSKYTTDLGRGLKGELGSYSYFQYFQPETNGKGGYTTDAPSFRV